MRMKTDLSLARLFAKHKIILPGGIVILFLVYCRAINSSSRAMDERFYRNYAYSNSEFVRALSTNYDFRWSSKEINVKMKVNRQILLLYLSCQFLRQDIRKLEVTNYRPKKIFAQTLTRPCLYIENLPKNHNNCELTND